jgi:hypothetical protein
MRIAAALSFALAAVAAGCTDEKKGDQPLPPAVSLGAPEGGGQVGQAPAMPPGHPGMKSPHGAGGMEAPEVSPPRTGPAADRFKAPEGWQSEAPSSGMRVAQFRLPRADGDTADGEAAVFGNIMGSTTANIDRWRGQFAEVAHGKDSLEEVTEGLKGKVTLLDITGKYGGGMGTPMPGAPKEAEPATTRMMAAVIEAKDGTFYVKVLGPPNTIARWEKSIREFILASAK